MNGFSDGWGAAIYVISYGVGFWLCCVFVYLVCKVLKKVANWMIKTGDKLQGK